MAAVGWGRIEVEREGNRTPDPLRCSPSAPYSSRSYQRDRDRRQTPETFHGR